MLLWCLKSTPVRKHSAYKERPSRVRTSESVLSSCKFKSSRLLRRTKTKGSSTVFHAIKSTQSYLTFISDAKYVKASASNSYRTQIMHLVSSLSFPIRTYAMIPFNNPMVLNMISHLAGIWCLEIKQNRLKLVRDEGLSICFVPKSSFFHNEMNSVDSPLFSGSFLSPTRAEEGFLRSFAIILAALWFHDLWVNPSFFPISKCKQANFKRTAIGHEV